MRGMLNYIGIVGLVAAGCGGDPPAAKVDPGAALGGLAGDDGAALIGSIAGRINSRIAFDDYRMLDKMIADTAPRVAADFQPAGCATAETKGTVLTVKLTNCTGPGGRLQLSGTFVATFAAAPGPNATGFVVAYGGKLELTAQTGDVNSLTVTVDATATVVSSDELKRFGLKVDGSGVATSTTWGSRDVSLSGKLVIVVSDTCIGADGAITLGTGPGATTATLKGFADCKGQCATGSATLSGPNVTGSITWSGASEVSWQLNGKSGTISVPCGG